MLEYLSSDIICSEKRTVFRERSSRKTVNFEEQDKYPSIFSPQMETIVFVILQIFYATRSVLKIGVYLVHKPFRRLVYRLIMSSAERLSEKWTFGRGKKLRGQMWNFEDNLSAKDIISRFTLVTPLGSKTRKLGAFGSYFTCLLYTSPSPRDA